MAKSTSARPRWPACRPALVMFYSVLEFVKKFTVLRFVCTGISYMLTPKFAASGFFIDDDKMNIISYIKKFISSQNPALADKAEEETIEFISKMSSLEGPRGDLTFKMNAKSFWNIFGRNEFPTLYQCAKSVNQMICSSAGSEHVWLIYRWLIHTRLRIRLTNDKVKKLAFVYINCAILDKNDTTYITEEGANLSGIDYQELDDM